MDQFVRVRLIQCNSLDLNLFQFDYDLTFAAFFLNADRTIYGRFGTRSSDIEASRDISITGFRKAMEAALALHRDFPTHKEALKGKTGPPATYAIAQDFPSLKGKYTPFLDFEGQVARSCIHCHMVGESQRLAARSQDGPMADKVIYPWPMPNVLGLEFDPTERTVLRHVDPNSIAARNGFQAQDELLTLNQQPLISIADVQWVLHSAKPPTTIQATVRRNSQVLELSLPLQPNWRQGSDIAWRTTSWDLRRIATGGLLLKPLTSPERTRLKLNPAELGLRVEHVGQYGSHAVAKKAGFKKNDIIIAFDGITKNVGETELFAHILRNRRPGDIVSVTVRRNATQEDLTLKIQ